MKKRAIHTAGTYEQFRQMVLACDQTPVSSKEMANFGKQFENPHGGRDEATSELGFSKYGKGKKRRSRRGRRKNATKAAVAADEDVLKPPTTQYEFERAWARSCKTDEQRCEYLLSIDLGNMKSIFKGGDINFVLLSEILKAIVTSCDVTTKGSIALAFLDSLSKIRGFRAASRLLSADERKAVVALIERIAACTSSGAASAAE